MNERKLLGTEDTVRTDPRGQFAFEHLPAGLVSLRAEFIGYLVGRRDSIVVEPGHTARVEFRLLARPLPSGDDVIRTLQPAPLDSQ